MSGAEALAVISIIANIVQLVDFTSKVVGRVKDSAQDGHSIPKVFRNIQVTLPLLASTLRNTEDQVKSGKIDEQTCNELRPVVEACKAQMHELKAIFDQALPAEGASGWRRGWKAISSLGKVKKVDAIARSLTDLKSSLIHHYVTKSTILDAQHDIPEGSGGPFTASINIAGQQKDARQRELEERCLHSLAFPSMDSRRLGIEEPKGETCSWFFEHPLYQQWDLRDEAAMSHGLLWIKGKPGSGKSTLMKRLVETSEERPCEGGICISFFFSARGTGLERSIEGLYRSLTYQLVRERRMLLAQLASLANEKEIRYGRGNWTWHVKELKEFFHASIAKAGYGPFKIFVDALDECKDDDVQEAVTAFERSAATSMANGTVLDICWSSRHYPHIRVQRPLEICMEHENAEDIATYVRNEVKDSSLIDRELESEIIRKAHGVFLWVVLVFRQLLDAEDLGQRRAEKKNLPSELDDLFRGILKSVKLRHRQTRTLLFQYAMVASEPLSVRDMQVALAFSANPPPDSIESWRLSGSYLEPHIAFPNFVREVSGGLLEISKGGYFQFIHESVRDFMQSGASHEILGMVDNTDIFRQGHQNLRNACLAYLSSQELLGGFDRLFEFEKIRCHDKSALPTRLEAEATMYSFVSYAAWQWPIHARGAEDTGQSQVDLVHLTATASFHGAVRLWAALQGLKPRYWDYRGEHYHALSTDGISTREALLWVSCATGVVSCIGPLLQAGVNPCFEIGGRRLAWIAAAKSRLPEVVRELLNHDVTNATDYAFAEDARLHQQLWSGGLGIVEVLLDYGFSANSRCGHGQTPMQIVSSQHCSRYDVSKQIAIIRTLVAHDADIKVLDCDGRTVLHHAVARRSYPEILSCLIDAGADVKAVDIHGRTVLHYAVGMHLDPAVISCLIDAGANVNAVDIHGNNVLHLVVEKRPRPEIISCLIDAGANVEAVNSHGSTVLHHAVEKDSHPNNISCLIDAGAGVKALHSDGSTVLQLAYRCESRPQTISRLIEARADINGLDDHSRTALHSAVLSIGKRYPEFEENVISRVYAAEDAQRRDLPKRPS